MVYLNVIIIQAIVVIALLIGQLRLQPRYFGRGKFAVSASAGKRNSNSLCYGLKTLANSFLPGV